MTIKSTLDLWAPDLTCAALSARDQQIIALTRQDLSGGGFSEALRVMRETVERLIPAGRLYLLAHTPHAPIVGSAISGVGITEGPHGILLVRVLSAGGHIVLGAL